jgi:hypothetical protein
MAETILTSIVAVSPRTVQRQDGTSFTIHEVIDQTGRKWVARRDVANMAQSYVGHMVEMITRTEQKAGRNGQTFTNHYVDHIAPANAMTAIQQAHQAQAAYAPQTMAPTPSPTPTPPPTPPPPPQGPPEVHTERDRSIYRQTAGKVAAEISKTPSEMWENIVLLARYFETGQVPPNAQGGGSNDQYEDDIPFD